MFSISPFIMMLAYLLDLVIGDPVWLPHPVRMIGKTILKVDTIRFLHSYTNFYLLKLSNEDQLYGDLREKGMLVRLCSDFKGLDKTYIRVAVRTREENVRLLSALVPHRNISLDRD